MTLFIIKLITKPIKTIKRVFKNYGKRIAIIYLMALLPANVATVAAFTPASIANPKQIVSYIQASGIPNFITGGLLQPALGATKTAIGGTLSAAGDMLGADSLVKSGNDWFKSGTEWFKGAGDYATALGQKVKGSVTDVTATIQDPFTGANEDIASADERNDDYYHVDGEAQISEFCPTEPGVKYTGRIGTGGQIGEACGLITAEMVKASKDNGREKWAKNSNPAGWGTNTKVAIPLANGKEYKGWFYNKSHLIADSLGGNAIYENVITGTRTQNVGGGKGGMAYIESKVRSYLRDQIDSAGRPIMSKYCPVTYSATPVYQGSEIMPRTVIVNAKSCNGDINEKVTVFNDAKGFTIDYNTGEYAEK